MATVTDHGTSSVMEGVGGSLLDYYRGEAKSFPDRYSIVEDDEVVSPYPEITTVGEVEAEAAEPEPQTEAESTPEPDVEPTPEPDLAPQPTVEPEDDHPRPFSA